MKKLLALLIVAAFAVPAMAVEKAKAPTAKKEIKKHKKAEATGKVADDKPTKPVAKKK